MLGNQARAPHPVLKLSGTGFSCQALHGQTLERISKGVPEFRTGERAGAGQLPVQQIDLALLAVRSIGVHRR